MLKNRTLMIGLTLSALIASRATGRAAGYEELVRKIEQNNRLTDMSYSYSIALRQLGTAKALDSISGKMYASGLRYLDSNSRYLSLRSDQYFCKLVFKERSAEVASNEQIRQRFGGKLPDKPQNMFSMSQEVFKEYSRIIVDSTSDRRHYRIRILLKLRDMPEVNMVISKSDYRLTAMQIELLEDGEEQYRRMIRVFDIRHSVPPGLFSTGRFFTASGNKITLQGKYSTYKLQPAAR